MHTEVTRQDAVIRKIFGWDRICGQDTCKRFFNKFTQEKNQQVFTLMDQWFFRNLRFDNYTLDLDSSVWTRYGDQEGARVGYNAKKPGRKSHHPLMAFVTDCRMVIVRQKIQERPKATGKQLRLFQDSDMYSQYHYHCFITNLTLPAIQVWNLYKDRAEAENRIKELKYDFGFDSFNLHSFYGTEAALNMVMLAYNLMSLFRQSIIGTKVRQKMSTLRYKLFALGFIPVIPA